jgi:hypothetical protein
MLQEDNQLVNPPVSLVAAIGPDHSVFGAPVLDFDVNAILTYESCYMVGTLCFLAFLLDTHLPFSVS